MPSKKPAVSFRPDIQLSKEFDELLGKIQVNGDDRRGGYSGRPSDAPTRTAVLEALMSWAIACGELKDPALIDLPGMVKIGARWREGGGA